MRLSNPSQGCNIVGDIWIKLLQHFAYMPRHDLKSRVPKMYGLKPWPVHKRLHIKIQLSNYIFFASKPPILHEKTTIQDPISKHTEDPENARNPGIHDGQPGKSTQKNIFKKKRARWAIRMRAGINWIPPVAPQIKQISTCRNESNPNREDESETQEGKVEKRIYLERNEMAAPGPRKRTESATVSLTILRGAGGRYINSGRRLAER